MEENGPSGSDAAKELTTTESSATRVDTATKSANITSTRKPSFSKPAAGPTSKAKKVAPAPAPPLGIRNAAGAGSSGCGNRTSSRQPDRLASLTRSTAASAARKVSSSGGTTSTTTATAAATRPTTFLVPSRVLAPTEASKAHTSGPPPRLGQRSTTATTQPYRHGPRTEPAPTSSLKSSAADKRTTRPALHHPAAPRQDKTPGTYTEPKGSGRMNAEVVEEAAGTSAIREDIIQADQKISTLSADLNKQISIVQQQADAIAGLEQKCREYEQRIAELEKELTLATDATVAKLEVEISNIKQTNATEMENLQSKLARDKQMYDDQVAALGANLAQTEAQVGLRERELEGNSKVIKSLQEELRTTVETMQETARTELEMLAKSYDGWKDKDYVDSLEKELESLKISAGSNAEILSLNKTIDDLKAKNTGQGDLITALETKIEVLTATVKSQGEENTNLSLANAAMSKELEMHVRQLAETNQDLQDVLAQQDQLKALAALLQSEKANADKNVADMRQIFGELETNVDSLNSELKA
ncbi:hypothetical protein V1509DRAFT_618451 [Lipomyces kononenkoae]